MKARLALLAPAAGGAFGADPAPKSFFGTIDAPMGSGHVVLFGMRPNTGRKVI